LRKDTVLNAGGYSLDSHADFDLLIRLGTASPMVKIIYPITVAYRLHGRNVTRDPETVAQGVLAVIRNEWRGVYPGGRGRMLERRGMIGGHVLWLCVAYYLKALVLPLHVRLAHIIRLLLHARGMIVAACVRRIQKQYSHFYSQEAGLLGYSTAESATHPGMKDVSRRNRTEYEAWLSGAISHSDGRASAGKE
jgi:hypothetical protein